MIPNMPGIPSAVVKTIHLITVPNSGHRIAPATNGPFFAAMFQNTTPAASQVAQSFDVTCKVFQG
jgi:hypothetical protein